VTHHPDEKRHPDETRHPGEGRDPASFDLKTLGPGLRRGDGSGLHPGDGNKTPATLLIEQEVQEHGPMTFAKFMDLALYHPKYGYYSRQSAVRGRRGDYFTSPQVSPLFPQIFADALLQMKTELETKPFTLIEVGSGYGEFMEGVMKALEEAGEIKSFRFIAVEKSRSARDLLWRKLSRFRKFKVVGDLEEAEIIGGVDGCIVSNEFFDALPFHRLRFDGTDWKEIFVGYEGGSLAETALPLSNQAFVENHGLDRFEFSSGSEVEVRSVVKDVVEEWSRWLSRGYVVTMDYGHPKNVLYDGRRKKGTWLCYHNHTVNENALDHIGRQDITAHVDFSELAEVGKAAGLQPGLFCSQGLFLTCLGEKRISKFLADGHPKSQAKKASAVQQLVHPDAMGEAFWVLLQTKEAALPPSFRSLPNRLRRLG